MISIRNYNRNKIISAIKDSTKWNNQYSFFNPSKKLKPSWFGLPLLINSRLKKKKKTFLKYLNKNNLETRPIISGNFVNQPAIKLYRIKYDKKSLQNSDEIEQRGFFIGLPTEKLIKNKIDRIADLLLTISN